MDPVTKYIHGAAARARKQRAEIFRNCFQITKDTKLLDLGSENGSNINRVLEGTDIDPKNVYIADISEKAVKEGSDRYGYNPVYIHEEGPLPFPDGYFDIVYCSSVIEHVTVPKNQVWHIYSSRKFREASYKRQLEFVNEIKRLGRQYFVQCPYKYFPVESHSWLPFIAWFPRWVIIPALRLTNTFWIKATSPDWYLLNRKEMADYFQNADILEEKSFGFTKSLMAVSTSSSGHSGDH